MKPQNHYRKKGILPKEVRAYIGALLPVTRKDLIVYGCTY